MEEIKEYKMTNQASLHTVKNSGITCLDVHKGHPYIITGGNDNHIVLFDYEKNTTLNTLKGHTKKITSVCFGPQESIISSSIDKTVRVWIPEKSGNYISLFRI